MINTNLTVLYNISVKCPAGWRTETCQAIAEKISDKRIKIIDVLDVGNNGTSGYASRTGAKRQRYSVSYFANNEIGKIKNLSSVKIC